MNFYERVSALCQEHGVSITRLATDLGFSSSTPNNWRKMNGTPRATTVKAVADYFNVPVEHLTNVEGSMPISTIKDNHGIIGHTHAPVTIINGSERKLTEQEVELLSMFEKLPVMEQAKLLVYASEALDRSQNNGQI